MARPLFAKKSTNDLMVEVSDNEHGPKRVLRVTDRSRRNLGGLTDGH
jgi:hypothetical protein